MNNYIEFKNKLAELEILAQELKKEANDRQDNICYEKWVDICFLLNDIKMEI